MATASALPRPPKRVSTVWGPVPNCRVSSPDRPGFAYINFIEYQRLPSRDGSWPLPQAAARVRSAGLDDSVLRRGGPGQWEIASGAATVVGTLGELRRGLRQIEQAPLPRGRQRPQVDEPLCLGELGQPDEFTLQFPQSVTIGQLVARHGGRDRAAPRALESGPDGSVFWTVRVRPGTAVARALDYLADADVWTLSLTGPAMATLART